MILMVSGILSAPGSLSFWEVVEYVSEAVVGLGCVGEYIAEYTGWRTEGERHILGRRSLIFLIIGIGVGLLSLIQTNALSGNEIQSLGEQAEEAGKKARLAIETSESAVEESGQAVTASDAALSKSNKAEGAASNALTLAQGARREADSFENDIVSAKKQAADAESHLAEALRQASDAAAELNRIKTPRSLANTADLIKSLQSFKGTDFSFGSVFGDEESFTFLKEIDRALMAAGWKRIRQESIRLGIPAITITGKDDLVELGTNTGVRVEVESTEAFETLQALSEDKLPSHIRLAVLLNKMFFAHVTPSETFTPEAGVNIVAGSSKVIRVKVGKKP